MQNIMIKRNIHVIICTVASISEDDLQNMTQNLFTQCQAYLKNKKKVTVSSAYKIWQICAPFYSNHWSSD
jgi:histidine ammonia-lyase